MISFEFFGHFTGARIIINAHSEVDAINKFYARFTSSFTSVKEIGRATWM